MFGDLDLESKLPTRRGGTRAAQHDALAALIEPHAAVTTRAAVLGHADTNDLVLIADDSHRAAIAEIERESLGDGRRDGGIEQNTRERGGTCEKLGGYGCGEKSGGEQRMQHR